MVNQAFRKQLSDLHGSGYAYGKRAGQLEELEHVLELSRTFNASLSFQRALHNRIMTLLDNDND